jgi:hypothetical protein
MGMSRIELSRTPNPADKQTVLESFYVMPVMERGKPMLAEMLWAMLGNQDVERHIKILPEYCCNILRFSGGVFLRGFPI